jgi:D-glycero-alpha-D-manno-heptose-7-phosphate kinase
MLITTVTPLRVSFLGGGSDYKSYFDSSDFGFVFGTTINLYVYISAMKHSSLSSHKFKISYREIDECNDIAEIRHPVIRSVLQNVDWDASGLHISTMSDVPAGTGLGSSSSFTVGFIQLMNTLRQTEMSKLQLAEFAVHIERSILKESGGVQDQYHAAVGGLKAYEFHRKKVRALTVETSDKIALLSKSMFLVAVGKPRNSKEEAGKWEVSSSQNPSEIKFMAHQAKSVFEDFDRATDPSTSLEILASGMKEAWAIKRRLGGGDFTLKSNIDFIIEKGIEGGAISGKLCGAGGSGFILFLVPPQKQAEFRGVFDSDKFQQVAIDPHGVRVEKYDHPDRG